MPRKSNLDVSKLSPAQKRLYDAVQASEKYDLYTLATAAKLGITHYFDWIWGRKGSVKPDALTKAEKLLALPQGYIEYGNRPSDDNAEQIEKSKTTKTARKKIPLFETRELPIAESQAESDILTEFLLVEGSVSKISGSFAVRISSDDMKPTYHAGDVAFAVENIAPTTDRPVWIEMKDGRRMVKFYKYQTPKKLVVFQTNPHKQLEYDMSEVSRVLRVKDRLD